MEVAAATGIAPQAVADLDAEDLITLVDVLNDQAKKARK